MDKNDKGHNDDAHAFDYRPSEPDTADLGTTTRPAGAVAEMTAVWSVGSGNGTPFVGYGQPLAMQEPLKQPTSLLHNLSMTSSNSSDSQKNQPFSNEFRIKLIQGIYIGIFAVFGVFVRMITAQVFGEECYNPGTVGWLASGSPLCVTNSMKATEEGGIIYADLPANMLGSFVMGLFAACDSSLKLAAPSNMKIAWLRPTAPFQEMPLLHKAITMGFCGSLTTFSGWNSSMVVLLFGTGSNRQTHVFNAIFGYIIGMEVAIGCHIAGKALARRLYRSVNPILARETDARAARQEEGIYLNPDLPDFERRFLPDLDMGQLQGEKDYGEVTVGGWALRLEYLTQWRTSTQHARRVNHPLLPSLKAIEETVLVDRYPGAPIPLEAESIAHTHGWNVDALREWVRARDADHPRLPSVSSLQPGAINLALVQPPSAWLFTLRVVGGLFILLMSILATLLLSVRSATVYAITDRTMVYAMVCAPLGAIVQWQLATLNGTVTWHDWTWFPLGTFSANLVGSVISIALIAIEYMIQAEHYAFWVVGTIRAINVGFVGALTTVSTFVAEVDGFMISHTDHAYPYILITIGFCCATASVVYAIIVYPNY